MKSAVTTSPQRKKYLAFKKLLLCDFQGVNKRKLVKGLKTHNNCAKWHLQSSIFDKCVTREHSCQKNSQEINIYRIHINIGERFFQALLQSLTVTFHCPARLHTSHFTLHQIQQPQRKYMKESREQPKLTANKILRRFYSV